MSLNVLFIGGTGNISLPCVTEAVKAGHRVSVFNRGARGAALPAGVTAIQGDMKDASAYRALAKTGFDVVCQFIAFKPTEIEADIAAFAGQTGQYIFISSASVYQKPPRHYVITEATPAINPYWPYSQDKIACEAALRAAKGLAWTIVRPSHTVRTMLPTTFNEGDSVARRMLAKKPVIVVGDGSTPWTLTRCADFAVPFVRLFGKAAALGDTFHITGDQAFTWNDIYRGIAAGLGVEADLVHVPTDTLVRYHRDWEGPLMGDKTWTALFDNSKVKRVAGDFACETDLAKVLAEPIASVKERLKSPAQPDPLEPLIDRIVKEQRGLGA
jgi:nucleoside-diphosphate-sugar epimerase